MLGVTHVILVLVILWNCHDHSDTTLQPHMLQQIIDRARLRDFHSPPFCYDASVTKSFHPPISSLTYNSLESVLLEIGGANSTPNANIDE